MYSRRVAHDPPPGRPGEEPAGRGGWSLLASFAARVEGIARSAEHEAAVISRDLDAHRRAVEAETDRYIEGAKRQAQDTMARRVARLSETVDELISRAEDASRRFDAMLEALENTAIRLATEDEMAVAGRTRADVDAHLRESFLISDTADSLDDLFGDLAGGESSRIGWSGP